MASKENFYVIGNGHGIAGPVGKAEARKIADSARRAGGVDVKIVRYGRDAFGRLRHTEVK